MLLQEKGMAAVQDCKCPWLESGGGGGGDRVSHVYRYNSKYTDGAFKIKICFAKSFFYSYGRKFILETPGLEFMYAESNGTSPIFLLLLVFVRKKERKKER
jgi:hypothetical protein